MGRRQRGCFTNNGLRSDRWLRSHSARLQRARWEGGGPEERERAGNEQSTVEVIRGARWGRTRQRKTWKTRQVQIASYRQLPDGSVKLWHPSSPAARSRSELRSILDFCLWTVWRIRRSVGIKGVTSKFGSGLPSNMTVKYIVAYPHPSVRPLDRACLCNVGPSTGRSDILEQLYKEYPKSLEDLQLATLWKVTNLPVNSHCSLPTTIAGQ